MISILKKVFSFLATLWFLFFQWMDEVDLKSRKKEIKETNEKLKNKSWSRLSSEEDEKAKLDHAIEEQEKLENRIQRRRARRRPLPNIDRRTLAAS